MIWQDSILNFMPEVLKCSLTLSICISDRTGQSHRGLWSVKLVGGKDAWAPRAPRAPPSPPHVYQNPVFTPASSSDPIFLSSGVWRPLDVSQSKGYFLFNVCFMLGACYSFLRVWSCLKGAPWLWDNPPLLLDAKPVHPSSPVSEGISPISPTVRLGSQRASSQPRSISRTHALTVLLVPPEPYSSSPGLRLHSGLRSLGLGPAVK